MGNSSAKEQRPPPGRSSSAQAESARQPHSRSVSENSGLPSQPGTASLSTSSIAASRPGRGSRPDLSFLSLNHSSERDVASLDTRRDARQERETRRLERERAAREKERERSMREESIDGGYLVTQGVYTGTEDYSKPIVRRLMIERRLAPFFRGLNEHSAAWRDEQLVAAVKGVPLTAEPRPPSPRQARASAHRAAAAAAAATVAPASSTRDRDQNQDHDQDQNSKTLTGESCSRSRSYTSESSTRLAPSHPALSNANTNTISSTALLAPSSPPFRPRSKTLASLTSLAKNHSQDDMTPQEIHLPKPVHVDGRPVEAFLYRNASECPICFLFYPPYLNRTRCCDQSICSECFVQIKRPDPHPPEHAEPGSHAQAQQDDAAGARESLVMEPAACPFCVQSELGVTYEPPPFRSGLVYAGQTSTVSSLVQVTSAMSSSSSLSSFSGQPSQTRRRTDSLSPTSSTVVTTDRIRPDWSQKLADANAHLARRSAAATALHSAAYSRGGLSFGTEGRSVLNFGRRTRPGRSTRTDDSGTGSSSASNVRSGDGADSMSLGLTDSDGDDGAQARAIRVLFGDHAGGSARRSRLQDLEDMMMEQAIRLSLVAEEERRQKEEREARAQQQQEEALMREGEGDGSGNSTRPALAAGKAPQRRTSHGSATAQASSGCQDHERSRRDGAPANGKGKAVDRGTIPPRSSPLAQGPSSAGDVSRPPTTTSRPLEAAEHHSWIGSSTMDSSQTRHASRRSSPVSLLPESITGSTHGPSETPATGRPTGSDNDSQRRTSTPSASGATNGDPVFAFSSLAAMMDDTGTGHDEKPDEHSGPERREASPSPPRELRGH